MTLLEPLDPEIAELAKAYRYCKLFGATISEYDSRPHRETTLLLHIDDTYNQAANDK